MWVLGARHATAAALHKAGPSSTWRCGTRLLTPAPPRLQVGWPGVGHIPGKPGQTKDYSAVIIKALVRGGVVPACLGALWC